MKIFQLIKVNLTMDLLYSERSDFFDIRRLIISTIFALCVILHFMFLIYEAHTTEQFVRSVYMSATTLGISISLIATLFKTARIFTMIQSLETIVEKSKYSF